MRRPGPSGGSWGRTLVLALALLSAALLSAAPGRAWADPADALDPATRQHYETALEAERQGQPKRAAAAWRLVLSRDPTFPPAVLGLGRAQEALGETAAAEHTYARLGSDPDAVEARARLIEEQDPEGAARLYGKLTTLRLGDPDPHRLRARVLARIDPLQALAELELWLALVQGEPEGEAIMTVALALLESGEEEQARGLLERYAEAWPEGSHTGEARGRLDRLAVETAARELAVGASQPLTSELRERVDRARRRAAAGQLEPALAELREVVQEAPRAAEAWGALGDVHALLERVDEAERAYAWAAALAPEEATWHARLGLLLAERYGGRRHREADELLSRALALRPSWGELAWHQGVVRQGMGEWAGAVGAFEQYLELEPEGSFAEQARQHVADLQRTAPQPPEVPAQPGPPADLPPGAVTHYRIARVYWSQDQPEASRAELDQALALAPDWAAALNLLAALEARAGRDEAAVAAWQRSLQADPAQPLVQLNLGQRRLQEGALSEARTLLAAAAAGGAEDAWYLLARLAWEEHRYIEARDHLDRYFEVATGGISHELARDLQLKVRRRIRLVQLGLASSGGSVLLLGLVWGVRRRTGRALSDLTGQVPEVAHDLAPLLSAIRHEVLKHNTTLLDEVAAALDNGDHHAVRWAAVRLYGERGRGSRQDGVVDRFEAYMKAIERLGRRHGVRLDLRRKDPTLAPMWAAMRRLRGLERALRRPEGAGRGVADELRALSVQLNDDGYRALGRLIREMLTLRLSPELLLAVEARVRAEPALGGQDLPSLELELPEEEPAVRISRGDLEDIVANLLRNALLAVVEGVAPGMRRVGLRVFEDEDPITGLEHVALAFRDNAPGKLTDAMIRGRSIGRGLGLAVDLITRHDGSIHVEPTTGRLGATWTKSVVVRLPRAEEGEEP